MSRITRALRVSPAAVDVEKKKQGRGGGGGRKEKEKEEEENFRPMTNDIMNRSARKD